MQEEIGRLIVVDGSDGSIDTDPQIMSFLQKKKQKKNVGFVVVVVANSTSRAERRAEKTPNNLLAHSQSEPHELDKGEVTRLLLQTRTKKKLVSKFLNNPQSILIPESLSILEDLSLHNNSNNITTLPHDETHKTQLTLMV